MPYRIGFVMEQSLGHITHAKNLHQWMVSDPEIIPTWIPVDFSAPDRWENMPVVRNNWTVRASLRARAQVKAALSDTTLDAIIFHTPVTAIFCWPVMGRIPSVVSMDATPINIDSIGKPYDHTPSAFTPLERLKNAVNRGSFRRARRLVAWCDWTRDSLVADYGIDERKITVIPPGVDLDRWKPHRDPWPRPVRLLFVGGDFLRKGGDTVLEAYRSALMPHCELDIVTRDRVDTEGLPGVRVHHGVGPNSPEMMALYARADIFTFPTLADVLPLAIMEAMASGMPVITTAVGGVSKQIEHGVDGFLIRPGDAGALAEATLRLVQDPALLASMGAAARRSAELKFNAARNYASLLQVCKDCAAAR